MPKFIRLEFRNAKHFSTNDRTTDFSYSCIYPDGKIKRKEIEHFVIDGINVFHVSNVLHVLFREKPVPSLRPVMYGVVSFLFEKAEQSYLKYTNEHVHNEIVRVKKSSHNSWSPISYMSWVRVKRMCRVTKTGECLYDELIRILREDTGVDPLSYSFTDFKYILRDLISNGVKIDESLEYIKTNRMTSLIDSLLYDEKSSSVNQSENKIALTVNSGVDHAKTYNGELYVPVTDEEIEFLRTYSKGACTILDGGIIKITGLFDSECDFIPDLDDYIRVGEINREKELKTKPKI
jgi:hypothetical protein